MTPQELIQRYAVGERDFTGIQLQQHSSLQGAELPEIILREAVCANLRGANLSYADTEDGGFSLRFADLTEANLEGTDTTRVWFHETIMPDGSVCTVDR
ncbi:pentapeptide repeat-containing protein [Kovacikia minuta CCNUW1]|uniref:pentapeptide repeat-containing protein n=1 Tax=Kovacikia minuta TaxID=2931930 RepID=UPI001CCE7444|nr:pentapeptide repeat-containing protein [Kovacikia minuta]UBF28746.1 pentapeptide repeat-containing protein [Kovacikia minuta CCNUW1]